MSKIASAPCHGCGAHGGQARFIKVDPGRSSRSSHSMVENRVRSSTPTSRHIPAPRRPNRPRLTSAPSDRSRSASRRAACAAQSARVSSARTDRHHRSCVEMSEPPITLGLGQVARRRWREENRRHDSRCRGPAPKAGSAVEIGAAPARRAANRHAPRWAAFEGKRRQDAVLLPGAPAAAALRESAPTRSRRAGPAVDLGDCCRSCPGAGPGARPGLHPGWPSLGHQQAIA